MRCGIVKCENSRGGVAEYSRDRATRAKTRDSDARTWPLGCTKLKPTLEQTLLRDQMDWIGPWIS